MSTVRATRDGIWSELLALRLSNGLYDLSAKAIIHRGQRGFFREGGQYTLSVLATGGYEDQEYSDGVLYHFPRTHSPGQDEADITAAECCVRDRVPLFYIRRVQKGPARYQFIYPAWITEVDHDNSLVLIEFRAAFPGSTVGRQTESPFILKEKRPKYEVTAPQRLGQARFRMACIKRYGLRGALCGSTEEAFLVACHLYPYAAEGSDDPRNGLILSANHHLLFDKGIIQFTDAGFLLVRKDVSQERFRQFGIAFCSLHHLPNQPAPEALRASRIKSHSESKYEPVPADWLL